MVISVVRSTAIIGGLATVGTGLWWFQPWLSLTVIGAAIAFIGIWSAAYRD